MVAGVEHYKEFVPWCQRSDIILKNPPGYVEAELEVGFKMFVERYVSSYLKPRLELQAGQYNHMMRGLSHPRLTHVCNFGVGYGVASGPIHPRLKHVKKTSLYL